MSAQLSLFRPRVSLRGIRGTVLESWPSAGGPDAIVRFDGPTTWEGPPMRMASVAGAELLVRLEACEVLP